ncbi:uncharacterized protein LOC108241531 [Kryptolebias marmoratus]|uniref:uncharacterized protein LOC108241531 n=1 Tax=Kryptolebias marmoratus TaxID=37003 RepID=UPI0007F8A137|nr:uncharacterized protein LOC108241531 [Kryptolebias marmoratus]
MDGLHMILVFLGVISCSNNCNSLSLLEVTAKCGDNITLYCDGKVSTGVYIVWFRNCSHDNQPTLVLNINEMTMRQYSPKDGTWDISESSHFTFLRNFSSDSYDLVITNATNSDEGLYYCGTKEMKVEKDQVILFKDIYRYSNIATRLTVNSCWPDPDFNQTLQDCGVCWKLLLILLPTVSVFSALLPFFLVYLLCPKSVKKSKNYETKRDIGQSKEPQGEDVCYAALEIHEASQRPKRNR